MDSFFMELKLIIASHRVVCNTSWLAGKIRSFYQQLPKGLDIFKKSVF